MANTPKTIAIVGCGPRGLSALENLFISLSNSTKQADLNVIIFEKESQLGSGFVYRSNQPDVNWLNISERALTIAERPEINFSDFSIKPFPSYHKWTGKSKHNILNNDVEVFPKRSEMGNYLRARYTSIASVLETHKRLKVVQGTVNQVISISEGFEIQLKSNTTYTANEVVLTIGHQDTKTSQQLADWETFSTKNDSIHLFKDCYPIENVLTLDFKNEPHTVGLRGFGLAMIDLARALAEANGGTFEITDHKTQAMTYHSGKAKLQLVPFSLDGLPLACKPLNSKVDALFTPTEALQLGFTSKLQQVSDNKDYNNGNAFLIEAIAEVTAIQYIKLGNDALQHEHNATELQDIIAAYLEDENYTHPLIHSNKNAPEQLIKAFVNMATNSQPISLDYCLGQVWRHCEPTLYKMMSHSKLNDEVISDVITLDERMKRYAFGPPIESLQQLLALAYQGTLDLNYVNDPEIKLTKNGWQLQKDEQEITIDVMVNTVLDSPQITAVTSPIVTNLLADNTIKPVHSKLGVDTQPNGLVVSKNKKHKQHLALLGRLAKGSVVGVDAILECFGPRVKDWADGVIARL
ncbi:FAD/NAD(P)-binding protein [Lacinutrix salivirga]